MLHSSLFLVLTGYMCLIVGNCLSSQKEWDFALSHIPRKTYSSDVCLQVHFSSEVELVCESNFTTSGRCAGVLMKPGGCIFYQNGTFSPHSEVEPANDELKADEAVLKFRHEAESWTPQPDTPWCSNDVQASQGDFVAASNTTLNEYTFKPESKFLGSMGEFVPSSCRLLPLNHGAILKAFGGKRLLWFGDSHIRNMFSALVAGVRGEPFFVEHHGFRAVFQYSVGTEGDNFSIFPKEIVHGVQQKGEIDEALRNISDPAGFLPCEERVPSLGSPCVDFVFVWAPTWDAQISLARPFVKLVKPHSILASISGHNRRTASNFEWDRVWREIFKKQAGSLESWGFVLWPWGQIRTLVEDRLEHMRKLISEAPPSVRTYVLNMKHILIRIESWQLKEFWHDICGVNVQWPDEPYKMAAQENCTGTISRALDRIAFTLSMPQGEGHLNLTRQQ